MSDTSKPQMPAYLQWFFICCVALLAGAVLVSCIASKATPADEPSAAFVGPTFAFGEADAIERLSTAIPEFASASSEKFTDARGLNCGTRRVSGESWTICVAPTGEVHDVAFSMVGDGTTEARRLANLPVEGFMAIADPDPYSASDRTRIHSEVASELFADRPIVSQLERPKLVALGTKWLMVEQHGDSYELLMRAGLEPGTSLR